MPNGPKAKSSLIFNASELNLNNLPRIDAHLHTSWTDGEASVEEMYRTAISCNLDSVLYSEHSRKTSVDWFPLFAEQVRCLPASSCQAHVGTEVKVQSYSGEIDSVPSILDLCDLVMASVHRFIDARERTIEFTEVDATKAIELEYSLSWAVLENPAINILGHVFGMSYRRFNVLPDEEKIISLISRAAKYGVAIEINSHYHPNPLQMLRWCSAENALVTFGSNAHTLDTVGSIVRLLTAETKIA